MTAAILALLVVAVALLVLLVLRRPGGETALLQQQLIEMRNRLDALITTQGGAVGDVRERLGRLAEATKRLEEVGASVAAVQELLKVPQLRGSLGEQWLEELLRQIFPASLYEMQHEFRSGEKVDAALRIGDRLVSVDAKFPLEACQRMLAATGASADAERRAFRRSLRARIDEIADKYIRPDEGTFEFALMYIPAENVYYEAVIRGEALEGEESIVGYALRRKVIPVSPNTFYAYLAAIVHGLRGLEVEKKAQEILESLGGLQQQFGRFEEGYRLVGKHLEHAARQYAESERQLGRIQERFQALRGVGSGEAAAAFEPGEPAGPASLPPSETTMKKLLVLGTLLTLGALTPLRAQVSARMFRQPDVSATSITFVYAGDIWVVPKTGGTAQRLTTPRGEESFPRFSPDGSRIAYTANYDGNQDVYVIPVAGGVPVRVTHHPMPDRLVDWYPDGRTLLIATSMASGRQRYSQFYKVSATGGMPEKLPVPYGEFGAISPDGRTLAYMPMSQDFRTWKRYRGGWNPDIWTFDLETYASENITHNDANDAHPMWHGRTLYFLSDRDSSQRNNVWAYNLDTKETREVTHFTDYDITVPAIGPGDVVFQAGGRLYLLDLSNEQTHEVQVNVVTDLATLKPRVARADSFIQNVVISPTGQHALIEARGDVFSLPAEHGPVLNLTRSSGVAERYPAWSPDGKLIAYWSDRSGEYELYVRPADGSGTERKLTAYGAGFRYQPFWSPDSRKIAFIDQTMRIWIFSLESGQTTRVDKASWRFQGALDNFRPAWSPDSRWLAYGRDLGDRANTAIFVFDTRTNQAQQVTSGYYSDDYPVFDPDGKYLYFVTNRTYRPIYSDVDNTWVYANSTNIAAVALRSDVLSPLAPRNDTEGAKPDTAAAKPDQPPAAAPDATRTPRGRRPAPAAADTTARKGAAPPVEIETAGFEQRLVLLPPAAGNYADLRAVTGKVVYRRLPVAGSAERKTPIVYYDLKAREEKTVFPDANGYELSADGKKLLISSNRQFAIIDLKADQKLEHPLRTAEMVATVDPRAEWRQIFDDTWRIFRDYFYDPNMHGVNWNQMRERYGRLMDDAVTRWDVNFVIGELISELNSSHTYRGGGDLEAEPQLGVGLLGVDWALENGAYRIARIMDGAPWDNEVRSPLALPGVNVHRGDYVLAVNGVPVDTSADPWAAFAGLAGRTVELAVNDRPQLEGARRVVVETLRDETRLRNLAWIEQNRRWVDSASGGRVGYIYVPSTGIDGQAELERQFQFQFTKDALIIDERWNSGGQIPDRFIELLNRPPLAFWAVRDGHDWQFPPLAHFGPKVMLINGWSGSGGDAFPYYFREAGLGPLIGLRTWGGLIGITGAPGLVDGGSISVPTFRQYSPRGEWFPEGHGVEPDIAVVDDPTLIARGQDPQLARGLQEAVRLIGEKGFVWPRHPTIENRWRP